MIGPLTQPWGKLRRVGDDLEWHPLTHHCLDVAAVFQALLTRTLWGRRLAAVAGVEALSEAQVWRLTWLAYLHDVGKLDSGFQARAHGGKPVGHVEPVRGLFDPRHLDRTFAILRWTAMETWFGDAIDALFCAAISHHRRPLGDLGDRSASLTHWKPQPDYDPFAALEDFAAVGATALAPAFTDEDAAPLPDRPDVSHAVAGLVMLADWIASDNAPAFFPYSTTLEVDRFAWAVERAARVLSAAGMDVSTPRAEAARRNDPLGFMGQRTPRPMQETLAALPVADGYSAVVLESDTGSGKTEAAIARFLSLFAAGRVDGLFFALPTRAAAVQIHGRVRDALRAALGEAAPPVVLAVPGYLRVDDSDGQRPLPGFDVLWPDTGEEDRPRRWAAEHPKRFLAAPVSVGTLDQALLSVLQVPHAHMRAAALGRLLLVVDEVHASDPYMTALLRVVLERFRAARGHVLLMSATLGASARHHLLGQPDAPEPDDATAVPYPLVTIATAGGPPTVRDCTPHGQPRRVRVEPLPLLDDPAAIAARALQAARAGARVLVLRNTVTAAVATQQALEALVGDAEEALLFRCAGAAAPHHSRFAPADRRALDARVEALFGPGRRSGEGVVLVATQTVEQSLDIDADLLLTDLCPMDVLLQRLGRLHRHHGRARPDGFAAAACILLVPADRDLEPLAARGRGAFGLGRDGSPRAYPDVRVLEATWRLAEATAEWELLRMNRALVEGATHPQTLAALAEDLGGAWPAHGRLMDGLRRAQAVTARLGCIDVTVPYCALPFPDDQKIATRLGASDRLVTFTDPPPSAFDPQTPLEHLTVPHWMAAGTDATAEPTVLPPVPGASGLRFALGERTFLYDRLGLRWDPQ